MISDVLWREFSSRAGVVLDSRREGVTWAPDDADQAFDIVNPGLPTARVTFGSVRVTARVGDVDIELVSGSRAIRRATYSASADFAERRYLLRQRGRRLAELDRDGETIAVLARPRRTGRLINWAKASVTDQEIALGHVLALYGEIGAPGAVANTLAKITP